MVGLLSNTKVLFFVGGVAATIVGKKILKSEPSRKVCVKGLAQGMQLQRCTMETFQNMKDEAQDILADAKNKASEAE